MVYLVPLPLECHPAYEPVKHFILALLNGPPKPIVIPTTLSSFDEPGPDLAIRTQVLNIHRAWGLAPWTGYPAHYEWRYAEDELGRQVAADARLVPEPWQPWHTMSGLCRVYWGHSGCDLPRGHDSNVAIRSHRQLEPIEHTATPYNAYLFGEDLTGDERRLVAEIWE